MNAPFSRAGAIKPIDTLVLQTQVLGSHGEDVHMSIGEKKRGIQIILKEKLCVPRLVQVVTHADTYISKTQT